MTFKSGGCIDFGQALLRAARMAQQNSNGMAPPPYTAPTGWYEVPPPAYTPNPGTYGWLPNNPSAFGQPTDGVYASEAPPPYPGIGFITQPNQGPAYPNQPPPNYPGGAPQNGYGFAGATGSGGAPGPSYPNLPQQPFGFNSPSAPSNLNLFKSELL